MADLVYAVDVSNWQGADLQPIIAAHQPEHIVVRLSTEIDRNQRGIAIYQVQQALALGLSVSAYIWCYWRLDPHAHMLDALKVADAAGLSPDVMLWLDVEDDDGARLETCQPWLVDAVAELERNGRRAGIYTSADFWQRRVGNSPDFARLPLWLAHWDGIPKLTSSAMPLGGWSTLAGKQWSESPIDRDVFDRAALFPPKLDPCSALRAGLLEMVNTKPYRAPSKARLKTLLGAT